MPANPERRQALADAALSILGRGGARALTHRAVDKESGTPQGTCANYFPTRADLFLVMVQRSFEILTPDVERLNELEAINSSDALQEYLAYAVERLIAEPDLAMALIELRLEAARNSQVFDALAPFLRSEFRADVTFHNSRGLSGGSETVLLLHHVVNGIILDALTVPLDPGADPKDIARRAAATLG